MNNRRCEECVSPNHFHTYSVPAAILRCECSSGSSRNQLRKIAPTYANKNAASLQHTHHALIGDNRTEASSVSGCHLPSAWHANGSKRQSLDAFVHRDSAGELCSSARRRRRRRDRRYTRNIVNATQQSRCEFIVTRVTQGAPML